MYREHAQKVESEVQRLLAKGYLLVNLTVYERFDVENRGRDGMHAVVESKIVYEPRGTVLTTVN
jgi:hypothetical protein